MYSRRIFLIRKMNEPLPCTYQKKYNTKRLRIQGIILTAQNSIRLKKPNISCHRWKLTNFALIYLVEIYDCFILQCAHFFSPEPAKKGVSIADYLPCVRTERKNSESEQRRMLQETQKSSIETPSAKTETPIAVKETSTAATESHTRQSSVRQRKFSFKKGKVR